MAVRIGAVIAAAGAPGGYKRYDELEGVDGVSLIRKMIYSFRGAGIEDIVVITGYKAQETEKRLTKLGVVFLRSPFYETEQMLDHAVRGLRYLSERCGRIFFCPAGVPLFLSETLSAMMKCKDPVVIPVCQGRRGHPILLDASLAGPIGSYTGDRGLKGAVDALQVKTGFTEVEDHGVTLRADKTGSFEETVKRESKRQEIRPRVKLQLMKNEPFFGPGIVTLLKQIGQLGSVREACEKTGMSYSKGWTLIRTAERETGETIVERSPGGKNGGAASVSVAGRELLRRYELLEREISGFADKKYREIFSK